MEELATRPLLSIAPMIVTSQTTQDVTNTFCRYFLRLLTQQATLYTEMIHHNAILKADQEKVQHILGFAPAQHPVVIQLGGCDPEELAQASIIAQQFGYDEINLNVGCPSPRVQSGCFGACLMKEPELVGRCLREMSKTVKIPCTVKCRLGIDDIENYEFTRDFVREVSENGNVKHFIVHARNAILKGLSPAENRTIPPLKYDYVYKLQQDFPHLNFTLNGGIKTISQAKTLLHQHNLYGCMIGRTAYQNPWELATADRQIFGKPSKNYSKREVIQLYSEFADSCLEKYPNLSKPMLIKPLLNMFSGCKNSAKYRQYISDVPNIKEHGTITSLFEGAMKVLDNVDPSYLQVRKYAE